MQEAGNTGVSTLARPEPFVHVALAKVILAAGQRPRCGRRRSQPGKRQSCTSVNP